MKALGLKRRYEDHRDHREREQPCRKMAIDHLMMRMVRDATLRSWLTVRDPGEPERRPPFFARAFSGSRYLPLLVDALEAMSGD